MNSLLDIDFDNEGDFGSEMEDDPFMFSKQKILEEILQETESKVTKKIRPMSSDEAFLHNN